MATTKTRTYGGRWQLLTTIDGLSVSTAAVGVNPWVLPRAAAIERVVYYETALLTSGEVRGLERYDNRHDAAAGHARWLDELGLQRRTPSAEVTP